MHDPIPVHDAERQAGDALHLHLRTHIPVDGGQIRATISGSSGGPKHRRHDAAGQRRKQTNHHG
jgi:hypothetical protein